MIPNAVSYCHVICSILLLLLGVLLEEVKLEMEAAVAGRGRERLSFGVR